MNILFFLTPKSEVAYIHDDESLRQVLEKAVSTGADFAELYAEHSKTNSMVMIDGKIETITDNFLSGAGIRVCKGLKSAYASTSDLSLAGLLKELCKLDFHWIRLHYLYPEVITDELIDTIAREKKIVHYLDIPIQHCNDGILKAMRRRNTRAELEDLFDRLRRAIPDLVVRTSLICGLPGEGEAEFEELCQFLREQKLQRVGVFQFSPEEGTLAAAMEDQVDPETAARRVELVVDLQSRIMDEYNEARLGTVMEVLCEGFDAQAGCFAGRTYADSVEIDGRVLFTAAGAVPAGSFVNVRITGVSDGELTGEIEE